MTDRLKGCVVAFDRDIREDDAEWILAAIRMVKGVASVMPSISTAEDWINRERVRQQYERQINDALNQIFRRQDD